MDYIKSEEGKKLYSKYYSMAEKLYYGQASKTRFLNPFERDLVISIMNTFGHFYHIYSPYEDAERSVVFFSQMEFSDLDFLSDEMAVLYTSVKGKNISHRDVLGSLLSLGIERDLIGDILVDENKLEINCFRENMDFIKFNLNKIKRHEIELDEGESIYMDPSIVKYEDKTTTVSSLRLDSIISSAINCSRNQAKVMVTKELIKLNYVVTTNPAAKVNENDCLSIRGHGRYYIKEYINKTKKDKDRIIIRKIL